MPTRRQAVKVALWYAFLGGAWILLSGSVLHSLVREQAVAARLENAKGIFFIVTTACLLGFALDRYFAALRQSMARAQAATEAGRDRLRLFIEHAFGAVAMFDRDMRYLAASPRWKADFRLGDQDLVGRSHYELFPGLPEEIKAAHRRVLSGEVVRGNDDRFERPDGKVQWLTWEAHPWRIAEDSIDGIVIFSEDVSERRAAQETLWQVQKLEAIGQLAGGIAHDFNNLLAVILMEAEQSLEESDPAAMKASLADIRAAARRAASLTRQLLLFSRRQVIQATQLDLNEVVTNLAKMLQRILGEDIHLRIELHSRPLWIFADAGMIEQVLMNLAVNARDAMPRGGLLTVKTNERVVDGRACERNPGARAGRYCSVSVSDKGCGIPADILGKIFEPFFTTKEPGKGTGLGLSTVYGIAQQHKGWVDVASEVGRGTTFEVLLPFRDAGTGTSDAKTEQKKPAGAGETILLVEDDDEVRRVTRGILVRHGYRVIEAGHGHEAIAAFEKCGGAIDMLMTDMVLPKGMHGREVALALRSRKADVRVVYVSGYSPELAARPLGLEPGEAFVPKPFQSDQLLTAIRQCFDAHRTR